MKIQAAILEGVGQPFILDELDLAEPGPGELLVRMAASGVCHSDWHLVTGATKHPFPLVPGHEGAGIVMDVGPEVKRLQPGDHVVMNWAPDCGYCFYCQHGQTNLCETFTRPIWGGTMLDGTTRLQYRGKPTYHFCGLASFAEYAVVSERSCTPIRRDVPLPIAALVGCAVSTGVGAVIYTAGVRPGPSAGIVP